MADKQVEARRDGGGKGTFGDTLKKVAKGAAEGAAEAAGAAAIGAIGEGYAKVAVANDQREAAATKGAADSYTAAIEGAESPQERREYVDRMEQQREKDRQNASAHRDKDRNFMGAMGMMVLAAIGAVAITMKTIGRR